MTWYYSGAGPAAWPASDQNAFDELSSLRGGFQPTTCWSGIVRCRTGSRFRRWRRRPDPRPFAANAAKNFRPPKCSSFGATRISRQLQGCVRPQAERGRKLGRSPPLWWVLDPRTGATARMERSSALSSCYYCERPRSSGHSTFWGAAVPLPAISLGVEYLAGGCLRHLVRSPLRGDGASSKLALGLRVITTRGDTASTPRRIGFGRYFGIWLSSITLGVGFIMAAFGSGEAPPCTIVSAILV